MLDRYFEIVDSADGGDSQLDGLRDILAEDVVLMHSGDMVRGRDLTVDLHRTQAAGWKESKHHGTSSTAGGRLPHRHVEPGRTGPPGQRLLRQWPGKQIAAAHSSIPGPSTVPTLSCGDHDR